MALLLYALGCWAVTRTNAPLKGRGLALGWAAEGALGGGGRGRWPVDSGQRTVVGGHT